MNESKTGRFVLLSVATLFLVLIAGNIFLQKHLTSSQTAVISSPGPESAVAVPSTEQNTPLSSQNNALQGDTRRAYESRAVDGEEETIEREGPLKEVILIQ